MVGDPPEPVPAGRLRRLGPGILAAALAVLVYAGTLGHGFAYDDTHLLRSPLLADPWNLREFLEGGFYAPADRTLGLFRPLGQAVLVWNAVLVERVAGAIDRPVSYHLVNVLLHATATFALFLWLSRLPLSRFVAGAAAVLWAVHPVHAEVAANVTARYESLAAVLGLAFLVAHRSRHRLLSGPLLLAALLCKESALVFLPLALAVDLVFPVARRRLDAPGLASPVAAIAVWWLLRTASLAGQSVSRPFVENVLASVSFADRLPTAAWVQLLYLRDQILPLWLSTDHSYAQIEPVRSLASWPLLGFLLLLGASGLAAWRLRARRPVLALCVVGYALTFSVASNLIVPIGTIMADRLAYVPSIFLCLLAASLLGALPPRWPRLALVGSVAALLGVQAARVAAPWKDDLSLFRRQVETAPRSAKAHGNLGNALREAGRLEEAVDEYRRSIAIWRFRPEPHLGLAQAYEFLGTDPVLRIETWSDAIRFGTPGSDPAVRQVLARIDLGRFDAIETDRSGDSLAGFRVHLERILKAAAELRAAPDGSETLDRGRFLLRSGDLEGARRALHGAIYRGAVPGPQMPGVLRDLARCEEGLGRPGRARDLAALAAAAD